MFTEQELKQAIFNITAPHLLKQGVKAMGQGDFICMYRGMEDRSCAIGCLILDENYDNKIETEGCSTEGVIQAVFGQHPYELWPDFTPTYVESMPDIHTWEKHPLVSFLSSLQTIHDRTEPKDWKGQLEFFAVQQNLSIECL